MTEKRKPQWESEAGEDLWERWSQEHIDHSKPLVYVVRHVKSGDVLVFDTHDTALQHMRRHPKEECQLTARNFRGQEP